MILIGVSRLLIFGHDPSCPTARGILKGLIFAEAQPERIFHQAGIGALDDLPRVVVRQAHHLQNLLAVHPIPGEDAFLCPDNYIDHWDFAVATDKEVQRQVILRHTLIGAEILPIFAQMSDFLFIHHQFQIGHFITPWRLSGSADGISGIDGSQMLFFRSTMQE